MLYIKNKNRLGRSLSFVFCKENVLKFAGCIEELLMILRRFQQYLSHIWAQLFKTNDVISYRFFKINISSMPIFLSKNCVKLLHCKSFFHFFNKNISVFDYKVVKHLTS